jgi:hypothetical protein
LKNQSLKLTVDSDKLVTLAAFDNAIDAHLLRSKLESEGIHSFIFDENMMTLNPLINLSVGGIKVKVMERDLVSAKDIVVKISKKPIRNADNSILVCPSCQSEDISPGLKSVNIFSAAFWIGLLGVYPLQMESKFYCNHCKATFKRDEAKTPHVS